MKRTKIFLILLLASIKSVLADGPPIDTTGKIYCRFVSITLDSVQVEHLQKSRWLELTVAQRKQLPFLLPKIIDIVDPFFSSCTCGMTYGMWYAKNKIGFCLGKADTILNTEGKIDMSTEDPSIEEYNNWDPKPSKNHVYIGLKGELFYMDKKIKIEELQQIAKSKIGKKDEDYIVFCLPPSKDNPDIKKFLRTKSEIKMNLPLNFNYYWY